MSKRKHHHHRRHHKAKRDFWRAWRDEQRRLRQEQDKQVDQPEERPPFPRRKRARFWREFFHEYMGTWPEEHWAFGGRRFNPWHQGQDAFNPFVANMLSKGSGLLPLYVLHLLDQQLRYGNDLMDEITERTGGQWVANPGAIYPLMTMLEKQKLISGEWEDPTKRTVRVYRITAVGREEMARLKAIIRPKLEEAIHVLKDVADDLNDTESPPSDVL